ncbi:Crp/Fnr family transcriptional regulator [Flammeovirga aprica]|uniref:Crp/Fnr family transcriptional regulator n=1 Tax=Flammeovirga aprica JL-4 TaxID=694437 RepID=A0A7X9XCH6_9BACT|nr:Crp/Fnr family transcriptional regulator [Flammeovirga aprica]NME71817.1 Crp/Fnr family transcriptional regulator [Flammeovirga aprica JL-4]
MKNIEVENTIRAYLKHVFTSNTAFENVVQLLSSKAELIQYPKKTLLTSAGDHHQYIYILRSGFIRRYTLVDGKEITLEFAQEKELFTTMFSIVTQQASRDFIETIEASTVVLFDLSHLKNAYEVSSEIPRVGNFLRDQFFLQLENRVLSLQISSAKERYSNLEKTPPQIIQRASLGQIASYLGITQETLSRIRARRG